MCNIVKKSGMQIIFTKLMINRSQSLIHLPSLSELSLDGEKLVDEEVRRALYGVKQMKEVMVRNEQKHEHLMKSLQHSNDKKKVRLPLTQQCLSCII